MYSRTKPAVHQLVRIEAAGVPLLGNLEVPSEARSVVVLALGFGTRRQGRLPNLFASRFRDLGLATLQLELLGEEEAAVDALVGHLRSSPGRLVDRLVAVLDWLQQAPRTASLGVGLFAFGAAGSPVLLTAVQHPHRLGALVLRGSQAHLSPEQLAAVHTPTLLIVGGADQALVRHNERVLDCLGTCHKSLDVLLDTRDHFDEPGSLEMAAWLAADWYARHLLGEALEVQAGRSLR